MKTDELIAALAADTQSVRRPPERTLLALLPLGVALALLAFLLTLGVRPDIAEALATWRFDLKLAFVAIAALVVTRECLRAGRPTARPSAQPLLAVAGLLGAAVAFELLVSPSHSWSEKLVGSNSIICLTAIPLLSLGPLAALMIALRSGAPTSPTVAGAIAGLAAAAIAATLYALHCTDDSPLFVAVWYGTAALIVTALGAVLGRALLRW